MALLCHFSKEHVNGAYKRVTKVLDKGTAYGYHTRMETTSQTLRVTPTREQVRAKYETDLQVVGLQTLAEAARSTRPGDYIAAILDVIRDSYGAREVTYLIRFIMERAESRGLLSLAGNPAR